LKQTSFFSAKILSYENYHRVSSSFLVIIFLESNSSFKTCQSLISKLSKILYGEKCVNIVK
jgi:hypothetical protein